MQRRGTCPHCHRPITAARVLAISRRAPYVCPACGRRSRPATPDVYGVLAAWAAAAALALWLLGAGGASDAELFLACVAAVAAFPVLVARAGRFRPDP